MRPATGRRRVAFVRALRGQGDWIGAAALAAAVALFAMMAVRMLAAWQAGLL